jgi:hypothetical protein
LMTNISRQPEAHTLTALFAGFEAMSRAG